MIDPVAVVILVLMIVIPFIGVVLSKLRDASQPPQRPMGQGDNRRIQEQIDEFLRRASQRSAGQSAPTAKPAAAAPLAAEAVDDEQVGSGVDQQVRKYLDTSEFGRRSESLGGEVVQADEQFTQQVRKAFSGEVGKLSSRRGETATAPEVAGGETSEGEDVNRPTLDALPTAGSGLAELLGSPDNIVHAIIMSEILRRTEW